MSRNMDVLHYFFSATNILQIFCHLGYKKKHKVCKIGHIFYLFFSLNQSIPLPFLKLRKGAKGSRRKQILYTAYELQIIRKSKFQNLLKIAK